VWLRLRLCLNAAGVPGGSLNANNTAGQHTGWQRAARTRLLPPAARPTTQNRCVSCSASSPMMAATRLRSTSGLKMARFTNELE
jgi:hypothetical protein